MWNVQENDKRVTFRNVSSLGKIEEVSPPPPIHEEDSIISTTSPQSVTTPRVSEFPVNAAASKMSTIRVTFAEEKVNHNGASNMLSPSSPRTLSPGSLSPPTTSPLHSKQHSHELVLKEIKSSKMTLSDRFKSKSGTSILSAALNDGDEAVLGIHSLVEDVPCPGA